VGCDYEQAPSTGTRHTADYDARIPVKHYLPRYATNGVAAEQAVPADRFARKIVGFLLSACAARSRQLNGRALGGSIYNNPFFSCNHNKENEMAATSSTIGTGALPWREIHHLALATRDLAATIRFYTDVLGMHAADIAPANPIHGRTCTIKPSPNATSELHFSSAS